MYSCHKFHFGTKLQLVYQPFFGLRMCKICERSVNRGKMIWILVLSFVLGVSCDGGDFGDISTVKLQLNENPYKHSLTLDPRGKFRLEWSVDRKKSTVHFSVTVETKGYVGFGLSKKGKMSGADIVIGGVDSNGKPYFSDRHGVGNELPVLDSQQDYQLHEAWEQGKLTFLSFSRPFETCDSDGDLEINDDLVSVIWAFGEKDDEILYHYGNRGSYDIYLLDPNVSDENLLDTFQAEGSLPVAVKPSLLSDATIKASVFSMVERRIVPRQDTLYYCSFHKAPTTKKHHIIGYQTVFPTEQDQKSVHHLLLHRCIAPPGSPAFETLSQQYFSGGGECYLGNNVGPPGFSFCREEVVGWGVGMQQAKLGGKAVFFPEHVGLSMSEFGEEFFMLQVHYDNPNLVPNLVVTASLELYYTSKLRKNDGAMLLLGSSILGATNLVIPPSSFEHEVFGFCPPGCTERMFPKNGVTVFGGTLHTHLAGKAARLRHFRNRTELPWIIKDDNYNFNYQQFRLFPEERQVLPGDQLIQTCVYDSTQRNGTVVTGGYSTREEMCSTFLYYYNRIPGVTSCTSQIRDEGYWNLLEIGNTTFDVSQRETVVTNPPEAAGVTVSNYLTKYIGEWDLKFRKEVQRQHQFQTQVASCPLPTSPGYKAPTAPIGIFRNRIVQLPLEKSSRIELKSFSGDVKKNIIQLPLEKSSYLKGKPLTLIQKPFSGTLPVIDDVNKNIIQLPLEQPRYVELKPEIQQKLGFGDIRKNIIQLPLEEPNYPESKPVTGDIWNNIIQLPLEKPNYVELKHVTYDKSPPTGSQTRSDIDETEKNIFQFPLDQQIYAKLKSVKKGIGHRPDFRRGKPPITLKVGFLNKLHYDFNVGNEGISKIGRGKRSTSLSQEQSSVVHQETASLPSLVAEYMPTSKCELYHKVEEIKEKKGSALDFQSYPHYHHHADDEKKRFTNILNQLDYENHRWLRK